jgi:hypothetical protein
MMGMYNGDHSDAYNAHPSHDTRASVVSVPVLQRFDPAIVSAALPGNHHWLVRRGLPLSVVWEARRAAGCTDAGKRVTGFIIPNGELPETRPALWLPEREGYTAEWLQNMHVTELWYWGTRNEFDGSKGDVYRKGYARRFYDLTWLMLREPKATEHYSVEDLIAKGLIGVYGWRRVSKRSRLRVWLMYGARWIWR